MEIVEFVGMAWMGVEADPAGVVVEVGFAGNRVAFGVEAAEAKGEAGGRELDGDDEDAVVVGRVAEEGVVSVEVGVGKKFVCLRTSLVID